MKLQDQLAYPPRGMRASRAAAYVGMSETSFLALVAEGKLPRPKRVKGMTIWDRLELDAAFEALTDEEQTRQRNLIDEYLRDTKESPNSNM
jgi:predicted DNA-binding transcriptional regulator AlpA